MSANKKETMSDRPTPTREEVMFQLQRLIHQHDDSPRRVGYHPDSLWLEEVRHHILATERKLAEANERSEQMGKLAHTNACEAMGYRSKLAEARVALDEFMQEMGAFKGDLGVAFAMKKAREALARIDANSPAHPPTVGCGECSNHETP